LLEGLKVIGSSVLPLPAGEPLSDLLEQEPVAIWIAERGIGLV
jgi:hypothetical protein